jgi:hypothetical protein
LRALITRAGGEAVDLDELIRRTGSKSDVPERRFPERKDEKSDLKEKPDFKEKPAPKFTPAGNDSREALTREIQKLRRENDRLLQEMKALFKEQDAARAARAQAKDAAPQRAKDQAQLERMRLEIMALADSLKKSGEDRLGLKQKADKLLQEAVAARDLAEKAEVRSLHLKKDLRESKKEILEAAKRYQDLALALRLGKEAAANRFAGLPLTGQNALFLIDMSGSMEMVDENTLDPDKWPFLCVQVAKIMKSLPDLKRYQVILFSDKVRYPFGRRGEWLEYDPKTTPQTVLKGLRAVKPKGETNMYDAFEEAFAFRSQKLDTIYLFSDGLPNTGKGLPPNSQNLSEQQRSAILARHIRNRLKTVWNASIEGQPRVRLNTIGFFFESPDVGSFLWALAREHGGGFVGIR